MQLGKVIGQVVSTRKVGKMKGLRLLMVQQLDEALNPLSRVEVLTDTVNARSGDVVLACSSSSARSTGMTKGVCTDHSIVAIVDSISYGKNKYGLE